MGLLDFQMPGLDTPQGQGLLSAAFSLMSAKKLPGQKGAFAGALGDAGQQYLQSSNASQDQMMKRKYLDAQMQAQQMQLEAARRQQAEQERVQAAVRNAFAPMGASQAMAGGGGPTSANAARMGQMPQFDPLQLLRDGGVGALEQGLKVNSALNPAPKYETVAGGSSLYKMGPNGPELAMTAPSAPKEKSLPAAIQEYEYAQQQGYKGSFEQWDTARKRAGATSVSVNSDNLGLKPKDRFDMEQKLSADYQKATTTDRAIVSTAQDVANILKQGGALKDQAAIYKFAKALDPEGAVREADYAAIVRTAGGLDYVQNLFNRALTGEQLSPKQRGEMSSLMNSMASVAKQRISKQQQTFGNNAKMYNLQPSNVFQASEDAPLGGWSITPVPGK